MNAVGKDHSTSVLAEKLEAIIALSLLTIRMKDFDDLYIINKTFTLGYEDVSKAVRQTFARRKTALPTETPIVFTIRGQLAPRRFQHVVDPLLDVF